MLKRTICMDFSDDDIMKPDVIQIKINISNFNNLVFALLNMILN